MKVRVLYFASLADRAGCREEDRDSRASSLAALYAEVATTHGFTMPAERIRVAANGAFAEWSRPVADGDEIAFLPPVSGG
ncbi:MAG: MoaD/ThiS family protein [Lysobacterales bacterium]